MANSVVPPQLFKLGVLNTLFYDRATALSLAEDLERVERLGLSSVERESLAPGGPRAATVSLVRRRAHPSDTVAAEERRRAGAGPSHGEVERAAAGERDASGAGGTADGFDDSAGWATGGRVECGDAVGTRGVRDRNSGEDGSGESCGELHLLGGTQHRCRSVDKGTYGTVVIDFGELG
jgi:hypothetical protein